MTDEHNPTIVTVAVSASGAGETYHTDPDCRNISDSKTRQVARHKHPNLRKCRRCAGRVDRKEQNHDYQDFLKSFDASDVERGRLSDAVREECE